MQAMYRKTSSLKTKPKTQRAIIADILSGAEGPIGFAEIVAAAKRADYEKTLKQAAGQSQSRTQFPITLGKMVEDGELKQEIMKA